jgi:hypothetical protein
MGYSANDMIRPAYGMVQVLDIPTTLFIEEFEALNEEKTLSKVVSQKEIIREKPKKTKELEYLKSFRKINDNHPNKPTLASRIAEVASVFFIGLVILLVSPLTAKTLENAKVGLHTMFVQAFKTIYSESVGHEEKRDPYTRLIY